MERVKSLNNANIEWEYHFENMSKDDKPVAEMYYKGKKALEVYEEQYVHKALVEYDYRFITAYTSIFIHYSEEVFICARNNKISDNDEENSKNKLIAGCDVIEKKFLKIIEEVKAVI